MKGRIVVSTLLTVLLFAVSAQCVEKVYFGDVGHDKIRRCNLNGSNLEELVTTGLEAVGGVAIDRTEGKMYWADWSQATIHRANLDGSNVEDVLTGQYGPFGVALDVPAGKIYWTQIDGYIRRANLDGSSIEDLIAGPVRVSGIALDLAGGKMYWTEGATVYTAKVRRANLDGSDIETLITTPLEAPMHIALDIAGGKMYWADLGSHKVQRANLDGSGVEDLVVSPPDLGLAVGIDLDLAEGKMYFSDSGAGGSKIRKANLDGTGVTDIVSTGIGSCYGLALGPAAGDCNDGDLEGPWLARVSGVEPYDYSVYIIFDGQGTIDEIGSFDVPDSAGTYTVEPDCDMSGYLWSDGYVPFTGQILSETTAEMDIGSGPMPLYKVLDVGALEGCWVGTFVQDTTAISLHVSLHLDASGTIDSSAGFPPPVSGKFFYESGYLAGHIATGADGEWEEIMLLDATLEGETVMAGTFGLDCDGCPLGTFTLESCGPAEVIGEPTVRLPLLHQNHPNPFNPRTTIAFLAPVAGRVSLQIYDAAGRLVRSLLSGVHVEAGQHEVSWAGRDDAGHQVTSGIYFYRLEGGAFSETKKMVLVK